MHELPVAQSILDIAIRHAEQACATRVTDLYLVIGELSSIVDESIQFYWDIISRGTMTEGATLHFERIPLQMVCFDCGEPYHPAPGTLACPSCGGDRVHVAGGDEFRLDAIDIETAETTAPSAPPTA